MINIIIILIYINEDIGKKKTVQSSIILIIIITITRT